MTKRPTNPESSEMNSIDQALTSLLDAPCQVTRTRPLGGGCISEAREVQVRFTDPGSMPPAACFSLLSADSLTAQLFVKSNEPSFLENFECEAEGLGQLAAAEAIRVPRPVAVGVVEERAWLITTWIAGGPRPADFFDKLGRQLGTLHRVTLGTEIGGPRDNYLG